MPEEVRLPAAWPHIEIQNLEIRGTLFNVEIRRAQHARIILNGKVLNGNVLPDAVIRQPNSNGRSHRLEVEYSDQATTDR